MNKQWYIFFINQQCRKSMNNEYYLQWFLREEKREREPKGKANIYFIRVKR